MADTPTDPTPALLTQERMEEIRQREKAATPGRWFWNFNRKSKQVRLESPGGGTLTVMDFVRWGMGGAIPRFRHAPRCTMHLADTMAKDVPGREHHADWFQTLSHPDADFIAESRADIPALLGHAAAQARRIAELEAERDKAKKDFWDIARASTEDSNKLTTERDAALADRDRHREAGERAREALAKAREQLTYYGNHEEDSETIKAIAAALAPSPAQASTPQPAPTITLADVQPLIDAVHGIDNLCCPLCQVTTGQMHLPTCLIGKATAAAWRLAAAIRLAGAPAQGAPHG